MTTASRECFCGKAISKSQTDSICSGCRQRLTRNLKRLPAVLADLELTLTRQSKTGGSQVGGRSNQIPMPYDLAASDCLADFRIALTGTATLIGQDTKRLDSWQIARLLLDQVDRLARHQSADFIVARFDRLLTEATIVVDLPPARKFLGRCSAEAGDQPCDREVFSIGDALTATCRCGATHSSEARQRVMLEASGDVLLTASEAARAITLGKDCLKTATIRSWVKRGHLLPHGQTHEGVALYRVGDLTELLGRPARSKFGKAA